jgi:hypothetical protein
MGQTHLLYVVFVGITKTNCIVSSTAIDYGLSGIGYLNLCRKIQIT